ncbi:peptidoglycan-binding domain-containing protein [Asanoa siamensis]|uniref:Peptidoglycan-binding protein n=1 Tax=Asanoa siamensis TaxID=926357 RepID=A0ABQ4CIR0_9ACTN|nr:peptidoglycan-binding domain-containing protein [Asanoa siamensis]GIF71191.1 peptidoglycan-binding protein [Asanoa siamensis]
MRRTLIAAGIAVVAAGAAVTAAVGFGSDGDGATAHAGDRPPKTATVTRQTLVDTDEVDGHLGYGDPVALRGAGGMVTWLAAEGAVVSRGKPVYRVDGHPVVLLYGPLPVYRTLGPGVSGADVKQFEQNLAALGYDGFTVDADYTGATADAVREWQEDLGVDETGRVGSGLVAYAPGPVRITEHAAQVGAPAAGTVLSYTGTSRLVTIDLPVGDRDLAVPGAEATISLPDGGTARGTVATVGAVATAAQGDGEPTVEVTVTVADQKTLGDLREAPVDVALTAGSRAEVLTVPVAALVALAEGGYGVQVADGGFLAVETGLFAGGRVEVSGAGLAEGMTVGMPS